jgi:competence protein ComFC
MLTKIIEVIKNIVDFVLPPRSNYEIVKRLDEKSIYQIPRAGKIPGFDWIYPIFQYKDVRVKAIVWELKYRENTKPLEVIGKMMFEEILSLISDIILFNNNAEFLLIPIPMTVSAKSDRGYNQSEIISKAIIENDTKRILLYAPQWFQKIKETAKQSHSTTKEERIKNLENCFEANSNVSGKYVILIDDVVTTGSTLREARSELIRAGVKDVYAITIAH